MVPAAGGVQLQPVADESRAAEETTPHVTTSSYDFAGPVQLRKSYIVASTPRCGSTFLCSLLWQTGVLGAPSEYWNCRKRASPKTIGTRMMERLEASSGVDYLTKLLACRTSKNGIFGVKVHFSHFEEVLRGFPKVLDMLSPVTYIYIERQDKLAQAVSMARSLQTGVWAAGRNRQRPPMTYDRNLISRCLDTLETQRLGWLRWFQTNRIDPTIVTYEKLIADPASVVSGIIDLLGVSNDDPHEVQQRAVQRQSDGTNKEWAARFRNEIEIGAERGEGPAVLARNQALLVAGEAQARTGQQPAIDRSRGSHFFDRYEWSKGSEPELKARNLGVFAAKRRRDRYEAIVGRNRELFQNAHVLDVQCGGGQWTLAALDAGAAYVVGLESRRRPIETAMENFTKHGIDSESYQFVRAKMPAGLRKFRPGTFDVILCQDWLSDLHLFFYHLHRLEPKHVIFDTAISGRKRPAVFFKTTTFKLKEQDMPLPDAKKRRAAFIAAMPNHAVIRMLCERFGFRCHFIDWQSLGITNWLGIGDYEKDRRRTYVLDRIS